jgi:osmoprotectant transport system ATP-binding protein
MRCRYPHNARKDRKVPFEGGDLLFRLPSGTVIRLIGVSKVFGDTSPAVRDLSLEVSEGEFVCLVGPSGCGKTTTLRMINRLIEPTSGRIEVGGRDVESVPAHELRRGMGYVIQHVGLFAHRTVADNISTVPKLLGWDKPRIASRIEELLDLLGLDRELAGRYPAELSGGQQQRVGVARALAADPPILLMDEPFGAVDPLVRDRLQDELARLQSHLHKTIVFVTHDIDEAIKLADRVVVMNVGGVVEQDAAPVDLLAHPASAFVASFLGERRGIRRLSLIRVGEVAAAQDAPDGAPAVRADDNLLDALQVLLRSGGDTVAVEGGGSVSLDRIAREVQA